MSIKLRKTKKVEFEKTKQRAKSDKGIVNLLLVVYFEKFKRELNIKNHKILNLLVVDETFSRNENEELIVGYKKEIITNVDNNDFNNIFSKIRDITLNKQLESLEDKIKEINLVLKSDKNKGNIVITKKYEKVENKPFIYKPREFNRTDFHESSEISIFNSIPSFVALEALSELKFISIVGKLVKNSGGEVFYNVMLNSPTAILKNDTMKISVLSRKSYESGINLNKAGIVNDVKSFMPKGKGYGTGAVKIVKAFEQMGCFGEPLKNDDEDFVEKQNKLAINILNQIVDLVGGIKGFEENHKNIQLHAKTIYNYERVPRMPQKNNKFIEEFRDFLINERKIDKDIIDREIDNGNIYSGNFNNTFNNFFTKQLFFALKDKNFKQQPSSAERLFFLNLDNKDKKLNKIHIKSTQGLAYGILNKEPKMTWFTEAVIDNLSLENIFKESKNHNEKDYNYISVQGCNNFIVWLKNVIGIGFSITENDLQEYGEVYTYKKIKEEREIKDSDKERLKEGIKNINIHYINDKNKISLNNLKKLKDFFKQIGFNKKIIEHEVKFLGGWIDMKQFDQTKDEDNRDYIIDNTNINDFFIKSGINFSLDKENNEYKFSIISEKEIFKNLTKNDDEKIRLIRKKLISVLGTDSLGLSFDNDLSGLQYCKGFKAMCTLLGVKYAILVPFFGKDINAVVTPSVALKVMNDNNDIIKRIKLLKSKKNGDVLSQNFIKSILEQINFNLFDKGLFELYLKNAATVKKEKTKEKEILNRI